LWLDPTTPFYATQPNGRLLWDILYESKNKNTIASGDIFSPKSAAAYLLQSGLNVTWCWAVSILSAWTSASPNLSDRPFRAKAFNFVDYAGTSGTDTLKDPASLGDRLTFTQLHAALGNGINTQMLRESLAAQVTSTLISDGQMASFIIVYASFVVAGCVGDKLRSMDSTGNTVLYTYDVYAAMLWVCQTLRMVAKSMPDSQTWTFEWVMGILGREFNIQKVLSDPDESHNIIWSKLSYIEEGGKYIRHGEKVKTKPVFPSSSIKYSTFKFTNFDQICAAEALINEYMRHTVSDWKGLPKGGCINDPINGAVLTRVLYIPVCEDVVSADTKLTWNIGGGNDSYASFRRMLARDKPLFCGGAPPPPPGPTKCAPGEYYSKTAGKCITIPTCPTGSHFDESSEKCVPDTPSPSGGGGGGGGGGSGGALLLLLLLFGLILFLRR
jgi:hypothetical protein